MNHLLRTLAAVPPAARVLHVGCRDGALTANIARLGFDVWACGDPPGPARDALSSVLGPDTAASRVSRATPEALGHPDEWFDWVVATFDDRPSQEAFAEIRRVMRPGSWVWVSASGEDAAVLNGPASGADLAVAEPVQVDTWNDRAIVRGIFRRVGEGVAA